MDGFAIPDEELVFVRQNGIIGERVMNDLEEYYNFHPWPAHHPHFPQRLQPLQINFMPQ